MPMGIKSFIWKETLLTGISSWEAASSEALFSYMRFISFSSGTLQIGL
jgi:hypothetical protein